MSWIVALGQGPLTQECWFRFTMVHMYTSNKNQQKMTENNRNNIVLESAQFIHSQSQHVKIMEKGIEEAAEKILKTMKSNPYSRRNWSKHILHPQSQNDTTTVDWIFVMDLLNFSFWNEKTDKQTYKVTLDGTTYSGYWSLCACLQRAMRKGIPIVSPSYYSSASVDELSHVFAGDDQVDMDPMPILEKRIELLHKAGHIIMTQFQGSFVNCVTQAAYSAQKFIQLVIHHFGDLFDDTVEFQGRSVSFHKRVQILVADLWACFDAQGYGRFDDINTITMFADYRVPQALIYFGILSYSSELKDRLKRDWEYHSSPGHRHHKEVHESHMIPRGSQYEVEIRGCSIWAVELLLAKMRELDPQQGRELNAILIDFYLWDEAYLKKEQMKYIHIHLTRSIYY